MSETQFVYEEKFGRFHISREARLVLQNFNIIAIEYSELLVLTNNQIVLSFDEIGLTLIHVCVEVSEIMADRPDESPQDRNMFFIGTKEERINLSDVVLTNVKRTYAINERLAC